MRFGSWFFMFGKDDQDSGSKYPTAMPRTAAIQIRRIGCVFFLKAKNAINRKMTSEI